MSLTKVQIINETVEYYSNNPRGLDSSGHCTYYNKRTESMCAVGRCLELDEAKKLANTDITADTIPNLDNKLQPPYKGHPVEFWEDLQVLHDTSRYWNNNSITDVGKKAVEIIINDHGN